MSFLSRVKNALTAPVRLPFRWIVQAIVNKHRHSVMYTLIDSVQISSAIGIVAKLGVADLLADGPKTCQQLARETQSHEEFLYRTMRALASLTIFAEGPERTFRPTPLADMLRNDVRGSLRHWAILSLDMIPRVGNARTESIMTGQNAYQLSFGKSAWEYFSEHEEQGHTFDRAMQCFTEIQIGPLVSAYDFSQVRDLVDVGGGRGALMRAVLKAHGGMSGVLYDRNEVVTEAERYFQEENLSGRCELRAGNFFDSVPAGHGTYMIKHVLHDWDDAAVGTIFRNIRAAMRDDSKLLIFECLLDAPSNTPGHDFFLKWFDWQQMIALSGSVRTQDRFAALLHEAGMRINRVIPTRNNDNTQIIEAVPLAVQSRGIRKVA
jgi:O-methyltransferase domain